MLDYKIIMKLKSKLNLATRIEVDMLGVLFIGSKGAVATTVMMSAILQKHKVNLNFNMPSDELGIELADPTDMIFGGWDLNDASYSSMAKSHKVVPDELIDRYKDELDKIHYIPGALQASDRALEQLFDKDLGSYRQSNKMMFVDKIRADIHNFRQSNNLKKVIVVNTASTDRPYEHSKSWDGLEAFQTGLIEDDPNISTFMLYAYAALVEHCDVINFTPSKMLDIPAIEELADKMSQLLAGKDAKTGQTLWKTVIAPVIKERGLKLTGWYSTNILGNSDGIVVGDDYHGKTKRDTKAGVLKDILGYDDFNHQVHIHYYPPRGDSKEAWDNVDTVGWFDIPITIKVNLLAEDSILAAPVCMDAIRLVDYFGKNGQSGVCHQIANLWKQPHGTNVHSFQEQIQMLKDYIDAEIY